MTTNHFHLFEVTGVELEYMIVNRDTLDVMPVCDGLLQKVTGEITADYENGPVAWSNELVNHVIELKTNGPVRNRTGLDILFHNNIAEINQLLQSFNAFLLPGGAHPWMDPHRETKLWSHEYNEIYSLYHRIFDCRGHGWSNLQSTHINLPFCGDEEFGRLHAAIRMVLPIIPAVSASTPFLDMKYSGFHDGRLEAYRHNQEKIPSIAGAIVPEAVFSKQEYHDRIFSPILHDIRPYDKEGVLDKHFLNSRGAISRFDRGAIEIRIIDIQECPLADLAIVEIVVALIKSVVDGVYGSLDEQKQWLETSLASILLNTIKESDQAVIENRLYLNFWKINQESITAGQLWEKLAFDLKEMVDPTYFKVMTVILKHGSLARRLLKAMGDDYSPQHFRTVYRELAQCLSNNQLFGVD